MHRYLLFLLAWVGCAQTQEAEGPLRSLNNLIASGSVVIQEGRGNGGSTGTVLFASIENMTEQALDVLVHFDAPLFFRNGGGGQNMLATAVYLSDGSYWRNNSGERYISIGPRSSSEGTQAVTFLAYCVDFEKDNPSANDPLAWADLPEHLRQVGDQMVRFEQQNPDYQGVAPQLALWRAQGLELEEIASKFSYSNQDVRDMRTLLSLPLD